MIPGLGARLKEARLRAAVRMGRTVSQGSMAQLVTAELARLGSEKTVSQPQWSDYEAEKAEPSTIVFRATENVSGLSESYIAFGSRDTANGVELPDPMKDRKLTEQEAQRAIRAAELERRELSRSAAAKKKRGGRGRA